MTHDATDLDDLRGRLERKRRRFRFLIEGAPDGVIVVLRAEQNA